MEASPLSQQGNNSLSGPAYHVEIGCLSQGVPQHHGAEVRNTVDDARAPGCAQRPRSDRSWVGIFQAPGGDGG